MLKYWDYSISQQCWESVDFWYYSLYFQIISTYVLSYVYLKIKGEHRHFPLSPSSRHSAVCPLDYLAFRLFPKFFLCKHCCSKQPCKYIIPQMCKYQVIVFVEGQIIFYTFYITLIFHTMTHNTGRSEKKNPRQILNL